MSNFSSSTNLSVVQKPLYVITPTGDRQEAISLAIEMMNRQTVQPDMWIIVDDGKEKSNIQNIDCNYKIIYCEPIEGYSIIRNIKEAIKLVPSNECKVVIWEDDDYYPPKYLEYINDALNYNNFITAQNLWYYHVGLRKYYHRTLSTNMTSLHSFAMTGVCFDYFFQLLEQIDPRKKCLDLAFLNFIKDKSGIIHQDNKNNHPIHITGIDCKRRGCTQSHQIIKIANDNHYKNDHSAEKLKELVGEDFYKNYLKFYIRDKGQNIYIFSNVLYPEENKLIVKKNDMLVFLNKSTSANFYKNHLNKIQFKRFAKDDYGKDRTDMETFYALGKESIIPKEFVKQLDKEYDWNYETEKGVTKGCTTGYLVVNYIQKMFPDKKIILVNFGMEVKNSTYRCPWHNWIFEDKKLQKFQHINLEK